MSRLLIAGNWKMNAGGADGIALAEALAKASANLDAGKIEMLLCPPSLLIREIAPIAVKCGLSLGGQDCHFENSGAHTGDLSAPMLKEAGCGYVILGHSERRQNHHEGDALVKSKSQAAINAGLIPVICIGESLEDRKAGRAEDIVGTQLAQSMPENASAANIVIAYEPIWAIGTGMTATTDDIAAMHDFLKNELGTRFGSAGRAVRCLYGGSVKPDNAAEILGIDAVDGVLVGGASLTTDSFMGIAEAG